MSAFIAAVLSIAKAIPVVDKWIQQLVVEYTNARIDSMKKEDVEIIKNAITLQDQRELEKTMGSSRAGELSGVEGSVIVDSLPGVK